MTSVTNYYEGIESVAVIGNYLPRQCGIATFPTDLIGRLIRQYPFLAGVQNHPGAHMSLGIHSDRQLRISPGNR